MDKTASVVVRILILLGSFVVLATLYDSGYVMERSLVSMVVSHYPAGDGTFFMRIQLQIVGSSTQVEKIPSVEIPSLKPQPTTKPCDAVPLRTSLPTVAPAKRIRVIYSLTISCSSSRYKGKQLFTFCRSYLYAGMAEGEAV